MAVGILGRGFALYAYLPAFIELGYDVCSLHRYKSVIESRSELNHFADKVQFVTTEHDLLNISNTLVIARTPTQQCLLIDRLQLQNRRVFLEKPLAPSIEEHVNALGTLRKQNINFSIGYLFHLTEWFSQISREVTLGGSNVKISWVLPYPLTSWKTQIDDGGGLGSHYAIHFVPILKRLEFNYRLIGGAFEREIKFAGSGPSNSSIEIDISFGSQNHFQVTSESSRASTRLLYAASSPLGDRGSFGVRDTRVDFLKSYISQTMAQESNAHSLYLEQAVIDFRIMLNPC
jgi:predicted dehydrogenase